MTSPEFDKLADLLDALCIAAPDALRITKNRRVAVAYWYALKPYTYQQAREGVLAAARGSRLYPSVAEIVAGIPAPPQDEPAVDEQRGSEQEAAWMRPYIRQNAAAADRSVSKYARDHGVTWEEAEEAMHT